MARPVTVTMLRRSGLVLVSGGTVKRPCLVCGLPTEGSYCAAHKRPHGSQRSWRWDKLSRHLRALRRRCERCGGSGRLEVHHVVPLHQGGSDARSNLVVLCPDCHRAEHA